MVIDCALVHSLKRSRTNQMALVIYSSLIGQQLPGRLNAICEHSTVTYLVVIQFPEVNVKKRGNKVEKCDLAEFSVLNPFSMYITRLIYHQGGG